jgi:hypothetical protein
VVLQYLSIQSPPQGTIGTENYDGTVAEQVVCSGTGRSVSSGDAINLTPRLPW